MKKLVLLLAVLLLTSCGGLPEAEVTPMPAPLAGRPAPDFSWETTKGDISLSDFRGQVVILLFWMPGCPYCVEELPVIKAIDEHYADNLAVISVTADTTSAWESVKNAVGFTFPVVVKTEREFYTDEYWIHGFPAMFIIDREGVIQARFDGAVPESQIEEALAPLLEP